MSQFITCTILLLFLNFYFLISYFTWLFIHVLSPVLPRSPGLECTEQFDCRDRFSFAHMFQAAHKQWEVAILILIDTFAPIKFRIVEMANWLNLNKRPCWDSIHDPFTSEANPWTVGLRYLYQLPSKETANLRCTWNNIFIWMQNGPNSTENPSCGLTTAQFELPVSF